MEGPSQYDGILTVEGHEETQEGFSGGAVAETVDFSAVEDHVWYRLSEERGRPHDGTLSDSRAVVGFYDVEGPSQYDEHNEGVRATTDPPWLK